MPYLALLVLILFHERAYLHVRFCRMLFVGGSFRGMHYFKEMPTEQYYPTV